ncbi:MAG TPA: hypothetical protein VNP36_06820 [Burkholderiales bacterium]|nr:hypothetical protein [Burkholderiales bacterium]
MWRKWWLLFTVIWVVVATIQVVVILAFSPEEQNKALQPAALGILVPAALYALGWAWQRLRK